jgi:hypothetical protein
MAVSKTGMMRKLIGANAGWSEEWYSEISLFGENRQTSVDLCLCERSFFM